MSFPNKKLFRSIIIIGSVFVVLCCLSIIAVPTIQTIIYERCIESYGTKLGVQANTVEVTEKLFETIRPQLTTEMTVEEVHKVFNEVIPTSFSRQGPTLDGGFQEIAMFHLCPMVRLHTVLVDYSQEGFFVDARLYFGD